MHKQQEPLVKWFNRRRLLLFVLFFSVAFLVAAIFLLTSKNNLLKKEYAKQEKFLQKKEAFEKLGFYIKTAESESRGYALSGNKKFIEDFDATIDSIYHISRIIHNEDDSDKKAKSAARLVLQDSLIHLKVAFMRMTNALSVANRDSAKLLIAGGRGVRLSDSITAISQAVINNYKEHISKSKNNFWQVNTTSNNIAYYSLAIALLLIILSFYFLMAEISITHKISKQLELQKEYYSKTLSSISDGLITTDNNGGIIYMNPAAEQMTGWKNHEASKLPLEDIYHVTNEETGQPFKNIVSRILQEGKTIELENNTILKTKGSGNLIISNTGSPLFNHDGTIAGTVLVFNDITETKINENKLKESEEKYRLLIEQASDGIIIYSFDGTIYDFNPAAYIFLGYTREEFKKLTLTDLLFDEPIIINPAYAEKIKAGEAVLFTRKIKRKDGYGLEVEINTRMLPDGTKMAFVRDITERKKAEEKIKKSEQRFQAMVENNDSIIALLDENFQTIYHSPSAERITGRAEEERTKESILDTIHPDDKVNAKMVMEELFKHPGKLVPNSFRIKHKNGNYIWLEGVAINLLHDENVKAIVTNFQDISESKKAENALKKSNERYELVTKATSDTIWDWDIIHNKMLYNDSITKMLGYERWEVENVVDWWKENMHPDDLRFVSVTLDKIFENREQSFQLEYRFHCADGSYKDIFDRAFVIYDEHGKPARMIGAMQDVTHEKEEEMRISKAIVEAQEGERKQLGMELHDNVNQLLTASLLYLGLANERQINKKDFSEMIDTCRSHITDAIQETRKLSHQLAPASNEDVSLKEAFELLMLNMNSNNCFAVNFHFDDFKSEIIGQGIQIALYRILQEQMNNILKYAKAGIVEVSVTIGDGIVKLRIADNGIGFNTNDVKTGIGLENIKRRTEMYSGKFTCTSSPGQGCEVVVIIPLISS